MVGGLPGVGIVWGSFSRTFIVVVHPLRLPLRGASGHGRGESHAAFEVKRFVASKVQGDRDFDMLGENVGRDHGWRNLIEHVVMFVGLGRWCGAAGGSLRRTGSANVSPRSIG